jgi:hypothetical protein
MAKAFATPAAKNVCKVAATTMGKTERAVPNTSNPAIARNR